MTSKSMRSIIATELMRLATYIDQTESPSLSYVKDSLRRLATRSNTSRHFEKSIVNDIDKLTNWIDTSHGQDLLRSFDVLKESTEQDPSRVPAALKHISHLADEVLIYIKT